VEMPDRAFLIFERGKRNPPPIEAGDICMLVIETEHTGMLVTL